jgi:MFS family permease
VKQVGQALSAAIAVFRNPDLRRLELSWLGSIAGEFSYAVVISVYAYSHGGATAVGVVWVIRMVPAALAAPFLSVAGDRWRRERVMVVGNLVRGGATAATAAALFTDAPAELVYGLGVIVAVISTAYWPAQAALLPADARTPQELTAANTASSTLEGIGSFAGPALAGALLALTSSGLAFAATAAVFLWAAALAMPIRTKPPLRAATGPSVAEEILGGFRALREHRRVALLVSVYGIWAFVSGALNVLVVVSAIELLDMGEGGVGVLNAAIGVGGLAGALATLALAGGRFGRLLALGMLIWSLPIALMSIWIEPVVAVLLLALVGLGNVVLDVSGLTLLQRVVPDEILSRVLGIVEGLWVGLLGAGAIAVPGLIAVLDLRGALVATGLVLPVFALLTRGALRAIDAETVAPERELELLRRIPIFSPLPPAAMERLAASLEALRVPAGTEVIRQGDEGDRFYVLREGSVEVETDGRTIGNFGPGYFFGEIALLRDVPRTATVRATSDSDLVALERNDFVGAVTGHAPAAEAADQVVSARIAGLTRLALRRV